jgi:hypothetical protein
MLLNVTVCPVAGLEHAQHDPLPVRPVLRDDRAVRVDRHREVLGVLSLIAAEAAGAPNLRIARFVHAARTALQM